MQCSKSCASGMYIDAEAMQAARPGPSSAARGPSAMRFRIAIAFVAPQQDLSSGLGAGSPCAGDGTVDRRARGLGRDNRNYPHTAHF